LVWGAKKDRERGFLVFCPRKGWGKSQKEESEGGEKKETLVDIPLENEEYGKSGE